MSSPSLINVNTLIKQAEAYSVSGDIDPISNLATHKNYIFAGTSDNTVSPQCGKKLEEFYLAFQPASQLLTEYSIASGHAQVTDFYGSACSTTRSPYINNCDYDAAGILLQHLYGGTLKPRTNMVAANLLKFDQSKYPATSLQKDAYVYVPTACQQGAECGLHIAFHGCVQNSDNVQVGEKYVMYAGYNEWAEANNIIILYPQASTSLSPSNPNACFDWWGYAGANYATKNGVQMKAVRNMMTQLMSGGPTLPAPTGLSLVNATDSTITIRWNTITGATGYLVYRNGAQVTPTAITATQFHDTGLASGTTYEYAVAGVAGNGRSPVSDTLVAKTTGNPPPLSAPTLTVTGTTSTSVTLTWGAVSGAAGYIVTRNGVTVSNVTTITFTDSNLTPETSYTYTVRGFTSNGVAGPTSNGVTARTGSSWVCTESYTSNYAHVSEGRAYQQLGYVYALGSNELMGLYNIAVYTRLAQTSPSHYIIGNCP